jgi:hypothetical protein
LLSGKRPRAGRASILPAFCAAALLLMAGCGANDNDPGPGGVTVGEARALDQAAEMLDQQRLPEQASPSPSPAPSAEETPETAER